jgi:hypothetical protein
MRDTPHLPRESLTSQQPDAAYRESTHITCLSSSRLAEGCPSAACEAFSLSARRTQERSVSRFSPSSRATSLIERAAWSPPPVAPRQRGTPRSTEMAFP